MTNMLDLALFPTTGAALAALPASDDEAVTVTWNSVELVSASAELPMFTEAWRDALASYDPATDLGAVVDEAWFRAEVVDAALDELRGWLYPLPDVIEPYSVEQWQAGREA